MKDNFEEPEIVKESERIVLSDGKHVVQAQHVIYGVNGKKYPKYVIGLFTQDSNGFPTSRPKTLGLPTSITEEELDKVVESIKSLL